MLNDEIESPLNKIKKLRDARTDRAERILLALKDGDYSFIYDMEPIRGALLVEVCANLDRHLQEQAIDLHIKSIEQVIGLKKQLENYNKVLKKANNQRVENFKSIKEDLKAYWEKYIPSDKRATDAAILLEKTPLWIKAVTQPKRSSLEKYIREWQALQK